MMHNATQTLHNSRQGAAESENVLICVPRAVEADVKPSV